jgi:hypothetical protein
MAAFEVVRTRMGWQITLGSLVLDVASPRIDRGAIRAALTITDSGVIVHRDTVNLTSARSRAALISALAKRDISLDEKVLIALDQACRSGSGPAKAKAADAAPTIATTPVDLAGLEAAFARWLLIDDRGLIVIVVGAVLAHLLTGDSVWLLVVAPPGGTKSELLRALYGYQGIYPLSELTARTFASGLDKADGDPSLLARLSDEILVLKDFTTVLEMHREERQAILAQLREIYDGRYDKAWGTGRELHWEGRVGLLAGVTPVIDRHQAAMSVLGERFVLIRTTMPDRELLAMAALENAQQEPQMRAELTAAMHGFLAAREIKAPSSSMAIKRKLATAADFVTRARSGVVRDGYRRELEYAPEPEAPTRFAKVLLSLASGIAVARESDAIGEDELRLVLRVALDCLPVIRRQVIAALVTGPVDIPVGDEPISTSTLAGVAKVSTVAIRRALEDLQALGVVTCHKGGSGKADSWTLDEKWSTIFTLLADAARSCAAPTDTSEKVNDDTFSETSEEASRNDDVSDEAVDAEEEVVEWMA